MKPTMVEWSVGRDAYGRAVKLRSENGRWSILREAADQRDEAVYLYDLTTENLLSISEAVKGGTAK